MNLIFFNFVEIRKIMVDYIFRPKSVTVISWAWIILGVFMILVGIIESSSFAAIPDISPDQPEAYSIPSDLNIFFPFQNHSYIQSFGLFIFATMAIISGVQFLKLRSWAKITIEILAWISLSCIVIFGSSWLFFSITSSDKFALMQIGSKIVNLKIFGVLLGSVINLFFGIPLVIMLVKLRSSTIKNLVI